VSPLLEGNSFCVVCWFSVKLQTSNMTKHKQWS
jgi:hypothetical protein